MKVNSSNLSEVEYDEDKKVLLVTFNNGSTYEYRNVPPGVYQRLVGSPSPGTYFSQYIKSSFVGYRV